MNANQRYYCLNEAENYTDRDAYISDLSLSDIWEDQPGADISEDRLREIGDLYDLYHISIKEIRKSTGLSQAAFATKFFIPKRTIENWEASASTPPVYVKILLAEAVKRNKFDYI